MPCYMTNVVSVEFKAENKSLLEATVAALKWKMETVGETVVVHPGDGASPISIENGQATGNAMLVNRLRLAYSRRVVDVAKEWAKSKGWQVQQTGESKLTIKKGMCHMADNTFNVEVLPDGKIKVTSVGGFAKEIHADADAFLKMIQDLAGGETVTRKLQPGLGNPHVHSHGDQHHKH